MCKCLTPIASDIFVTSLRLFEADENLANSWLQDELRLRKRGFPGVLASVFPGETHRVERDALGCALILDTMDVIQVAQTCSEVPEPYSSLRLCVFARDRF